MTEQFQPENTSDAKDYAMKIVRSEAEQEAFRIGWAAGFNRGFVAGCRAEKVQPSEVLFNRPA